MSIPVIAIIDVGKTNKKLFLFDQQYRVLFETSERLPETIDDDGDPCESVESLREFVLHSLAQIDRNKFDLKAINFSAYGASFVYLNEEGRPLTPLYNYLKSYPASLSKKFYEAYGGEENFSTTTASPVLGSLNSGMQLYRLRQERPELFARIKYALHLPQYLSYLITGKGFSDITSIGCHTNMWDFTKNDYHEWIYQQGVDKVLGPIMPCDYTTRVKHNGDDIAAGIGMHDSSAALIPYQVNFHEPFVLISTGTWCISLNPFNDEVLTTDELQQDCLCYLHYKGKPVKASRLFAGQEHEEQVARIANYFGQDVNRYRSMQFNAGIFSKLQDKKTELPVELKNTIRQSVFGARGLSQFSSDEEAYHQLMIDIIQQQVASTGLVLKGRSVKRIFVDGGFSRNSIYMNLLAAAFPHLEVFATSMAQATALGAALAVHEAWNKSALPNNLISLEYYSSAAFSVDSVK